MKSLLLLIFLSICQSLTVRGQTIAVTVNGFNNPKGVCMACLYSNAEGFPTKLNKALTCINAKIVGSSATLTFANVPVGTYALAIVHDENKNGNMDTNFMGIPKEGYGVSNNTPSRLGPPKFANAAFRVGKTDTQLTIDMRY